MRNETEVIHSVLNFAENNDIIRAALLNGSRANPNVARDIFCDYDIGLYVTDPDHFWHDRSWIQQFGELIILQANEWEVGEASGYIFLMLFSDGVRIDLAFDPIEHFDLFLDDSLTVILMDKDQVMPTLPPHQSVRITPKNQPKRNLMRPPTNFGGVPPMSPRASGGKN